VPAKRGNKAAANSANVNNNEEKPQLHPPARPRARALSDDHRENEEPGVAAQLFRSFTAR